MVAPPMAGAAPSGLARLVSACTGRRAGLSIRDS